MCLFNKSWALIGQPFPSTVFGGKFMLMLVDASSDVMAKQYSCLK